MIRRKVSVFIFLVFLFLGQRSFPQFNIYDQANYNSLDKIHDIPVLYHWGPYSKKYAGISHIPDLQMGFRFDVTIIPGFYRNRVMVPNVLFESGYFPWNINADMTRITYRYELEWKDRVFVEASYFLLDSLTVLVEMKCVNNTDLTQILQLNLLANINYPDNYPTKKINYPKTVTWINALEYKDLTYATPRPSDNLVYNGWLRGEERKKYFLDGRGLGQNFGNEKGDKIVYSFNIEKPSTNLGLYYKLPVNTKTTLKLTGAINQEITLDGHGVFKMLILPFNINATGNVDLVIESMENQAMEINGFFIGPENNIKAISVQKNTPGIYPKIVQTEDLSGVLLKYNDVNQYYGMAWNFSPSVIREILDDELDIIFRKYVHEHNYKIFYGDSLGHYTNAFIRPLVLKANSNKSVYALLKNGDENEVITALQAFKKTPENFIVQKNKNDNLFKDILPEGEKYVFSQKMMQASLLSNIVYPIYTQNQYIRHFTPGKWWNSLYTWDSGFEALGMTEIDIIKAIQILNAYTTDDKSQSAFIHHGSPVPVQMYAFYDLWNKTQSMELLHYFYPRLKKYYTFLSGKAEGSTTNEYKSNLLKTWDYFYNSGGWDDYPPQKAVRDNGFEKTVSPVITTAHCIRVAKILYQTARVLGHNKDLKEFENDIALFTEALQNIAWDKEIGYFSYIVHDSLGNPESIFRYPENRQNYNMGLDGAYPLFSGICTKEQQDILIDKIFSVEHMWTQAGICVVDKKAAYYRNDGYWNGAVWMPHQWFIWKTMLDLGKTELAFKIANTALELWKKETDETYFTYEHFIVDVARGAGWHQFGALSAPVLNWFAAYYKPGIATVGFETWINKQNFSPDNTGYSASLSFDKLTKEHKRGMIVCLNPSYQYNVKINNKLVECNMRWNGLLEIPLPVSNNNCDIFISKL